MAFESIIYEKVGNVAKITMNRPEVLNAYTEAMVDEMLAAIDDVRKDDAIQVLVLTGVGRGFCIGADIKRPIRPYAGKAIGGVIDLREGIHLLAWNLWRLDKITIAAINGMTACGGLTLALVCDLRIASDQAIFTEASLVNGFLPDEGELYLLPRALGREKAMEMILLGERLSAAKALEMGLVGRVVANAELEKATRELALRICQGPPIIQRLMKLSLLKQLNMDFWSAMEDTQLAQGVGSNTDDFREAGKAFREKRRPVFKRAGPK
ncbi:MAG: enoyl-CoA hydratase/isomerase family protein [Chloroflexi bacterium]|nr:enoyl-CoA hydratase/isomerase family protein [Chloroflexota bacterium]